MAADQSKVMATGSGNGTEEKGLPKLRVGGVPEHFNLPWMLAMEMGLFEKAGVKVEWVEQKLGTGAMLTALQSGEVDVIVALTEGIVSQIARSAGNHDIKIVSSYVETPLCWAISTGASAPFASVADLKGQSFGVSRLTSGSHLMAIVLAQQRGWDPKKDVSFKVTGDFKALRDSVNKGDTAAFMWENFTTKPFHDSGEVKRIGDITTPWPCFMMAARKNMLDDAGRADALRKAMEVIRQACRIFHCVDCKEEERGAALLAMQKLVAERYSLKPEDAKEWYKNVHVTAADTVSEGALQRVLSLLAKAGVLTEKEGAIPVSDLIDLRFVRPRRDITDMRLYNEPELLVRLHTGLRHLGKERGPLRVAELAQFDQNHYDGLNALRTCADMIGLKALSESKSTAAPQILNIGSGLGGPSRFLAHTYQCDVLAVELQHDLHATATELTARCKSDLLGKVTHMGGDILSVGRHLQPGYHAIVSWLTILHFDEKERVNLFETAFRLLSPGGYFFAEDFIEQTENSLTTYEKDTLRDDVFCKYLPTRTVYESQLKKAGFEVLHMTDMLKEWQGFTATRAAQAQANSTADAAIHGEKVVGGLTYFYCKIDELLRGGHVGGVRVLARKPIK